MKLRLLFSALLSTMTIFTMFGQITTVGLIGSATPGGWDNDTNMVQDATDTAVWTLDISLIAGDVKFRANDGWDINWGSADFPTGTGTQGGANIPVFAGDYSITFNSVTGDYSFDVKSPIGIIGSATPNGWDNDINMFKDTTEHGFFVVLDLAEGEAKFRKDDAWDVNWGSPDFPSGTATQGGDNIPVSPAGKYMVTFDTLSGAYNFEAIVEFTAISLIGDATAGGWTDDTDLTQDSGNPDLWRGNVTLTDGEIKFRANHAWDINWGGTDFPSGIAARDSGNIPAVAGDYQVDFNTATGEYNFLIIKNYDFIGIIGNATPGGWDTDSEMTRDAADSAVWKTRLVLVDGEAKFRADKDWSVNWGAGDFPSGVATKDGPNIPVPAGEYKITFNTVTGAYNFEEVIVFNTVGIIGTATPNGWDEDVDMDQDANNEHLWTIGSMSLTDGEAKFRAENDWTINWGAEDWPIGVGTQDGPNIPITGGVYSISINTNSGDYAFGTPVSTKDLILDPASIKVFPNPAKEWLNIDLTQLDFEGKINISIFDIQGNNLLLESNQAADLLKLNISSLPIGNYILRITNDQYIIGKHFTVIR